ncbi:hypothetical protein CB0940_01394 [Cercospora beticola]|uniref:Gag1-like clamp domain-containing protein n=1 Tax=Cercospora beticola TaxID=122368 RepID=A0A2G5IBV9_CERBT|nr:hypothetical protein CB0940_01394 [Cercospora beticola]PIB02265.1 hypothetical protein CB0940_01394 [Cercospora beticola]WPA96833.1 hypothetical protein RHO25_001441 [Cercospora beticola]
MTLHLNLPGSHHRNAEQQAELREARRILRDKIKDDWAYPPLPAWKSSGRGETETATATQEVEDRIAGFRFHTPATLERTNGVVGEALGLDFDPSEWRERDVSDASDAEAEGQTPNTSTPRKATTSKESVYKFDGPDSVGTQLNDRRLARKRKRHQALQEEMEWNDGLAHWTRRRDVWCCARGAREVRMLQGHAATADSTTQPEGEAVETSSASGTDASSPRTSTSSVAEPEGSTPGSSPSATPEAAVPAPSASAIPLDVLVPIAPPLLPNHPVRRRIRTDMYPEIYNKIILQSRTPSVPINLLTLIHALVQGWKDDGEWPPKAGPIEKSIGRKKGTGHEGSLRQGVKAVGRVLRLTGMSEHG